MERRNRGPSVVCNSSVIVEKGYKDVAVFDNDELTMSSRNAERPEADRLGEDLALLGFKITGENEARLVSILRIILKTASYPPTPLEFSDIFNAVRKANETPQLTETWVHRLLKSLVDMGLIRVENPAAYRKRYIADANSVMVGLERLKEKAIETKRMQVEQAGSDLERLNQMECGSIAQDLVKSMTGEVQTLSHRFVQGVDGMHQVLLHNFAEPAKSGDILRLSLASIRPLVFGISGRTRKFIDAAKRGADIRYLVAPDIMRGDEQTATLASQQSIKDVLQEIYGMVASGLKFEWRISSGLKGYNFVTINNERILLMMQDEPMTSTLHTREFNADLIDNMVRSFDEAWRDGVPMSKIGDEQLAKLGFKEGAFREGLREAKG